MKIFPFFIFALLLIIPSMSLSIVSSPTDSGKNDVCVPPSHGNVSNNNSSLLNESISPSCNDRVIEPTNYDNNNSNGQMVINEKQNQSATNPTQPWSITETPLEGCDKQVIVSSKVHCTNVTAFAEIDHRRNNTLHLYHLLNGSKVEVGFTSIDLDNDHLVERIEWFIPHLSEQTYEIIIDAIRAEHLDHNRAFLSDVSTEVQTIDRHWSEPVFNEEYVRVTFEKALDSDNDITIIARSSGISSVRVYEKNSTTLLATFQNITGEKRYQIFLSDLEENQTTFDLLTTGDAVSYDYIVDPTGWVSPTGFADPSNQWTSETKVYDENTGSYAVHGGGVGWRGFLNLTLSSPIYCDRVRVFSDFGYGYVDKVDIDIYNSTSWIDKYNGTITDCAWTELEFSGETNVTKARFRYHYLSGSVQFYLYEFDFWQGQPHTLPNCTTLNATSVDETTAIIKGNVSNDGGEPCEYRFQYGTNLSYGNNTAWGGSEPKDSDFGVMLHNLVLGNTYQYRVQVRNDVGMVNGTNKNFTTVIPSLGWVTPTSYYDPNAHWTNEVNGFDDDTDTNTQSLHNINDPDGPWSFYLYMNHSTILCDKVRFYARGPTGDPTQIDQVDLDVKRGGVWVDVYQGTFTDRQWTEKRFMQGSVNQSRIRFHINADNGGLYYELYEFDFNKSRPVPMLINEGPSNRSWGTALRPQMNITVNNPDGASMMITWSSNSSGSWQLFGTNTSVVNGTYHQRNINFSSNNSKYWWKISVTDGTDINTSWYYFSTPDFLHPSSNVVVITPYWKKTSPISIIATASDAGWSGVKNVTLYYRFSNNNASWDGWRNVGVDTASPWSWSFAFSNGTGYYQFYTVARDNASNVEDIPGGADARSGYDTTAPNSTVGAITPYWKKIVTTITATASDATSGVKNITLYYRFSSNNASWGKWISAGLDSSFPWSWNFLFTNGSGYYQFYSITKDNATNAESAPGSADTRCGYDNQTPASVINSMSGYWKTASPLSMTATTSDNGPSGLKNVTLFYRYRPMNVSSWRRNMSFGIDVDPWVSCSWSFTFPNGTGHYQLYSIAADNVSNIESIPGSADIEIGYDDQAPSSSVNPIFVYWKTSSLLTIMATASDAGSGVKNVTLYYRYSFDNISWGGWKSAGIDTTPPWSWSFPFSNGTGYYQFFSIAQDNLSFLEASPGTPDALCGFDDKVPSSSVTTITPYWRSSSLQTFLGTASDSLYERYNSGDDGSFPGFGSIWKSQTFTIGNSGNNVTHMMTSLRMKMYRTGSPGTITVGIRATDGAGKPTGNDLTNGTINGNTLTTDSQGQWYKINFTTAVTLNANTKYAIVARAPSGSMNNWFMWRFNSSNPTYTGGSYISSGDGGTTWTINVASDLLFEEYSNPLSGVKNVTLWYRYRTLNSTNWGGWVNPGLIDADPWVAVSWNFAFPNGTGHYQFFSITRDNATNIESTPGTADAWCGYDDTAPSSSVDPIFPYWKTASTLITASANDTTSGVKNVTLYYQFSSDNLSWGNWVSAGVDSALPWSWSFSFSNGSGHYQFASVAQDNATFIESFPGSADAKCGFDSLAPTSSLNAIQPYWKKTNSVTITGTAVDPGGSGLRNVTLYYRYRNTNGTGWGGWIKSPSLWGSNPITTPWLGISWTFNCPNGTGHYQFYSIATDNVSNSEAAPGIADSSCGYDNTAPTSSVGTISPYWVKNTRIITSSPNDDLSGIYNMTLFYQYSFDNISWGGWTNGGIDIASPWTWSFSFSNGSGYYKFYCIARDNATNVEPTPGSADAWCGYDNQAPSSSVEAITGFWKTSSPIFIHATASDTGQSGLRNVSLYFRYRATNLSNWGGNVSYAVDSTPWLSINWSFSFPNGTGHYQFYSIAIDNATNIEASPGGSGDASCGFNTGAPLSAVNTIVPYWRSTSNFVVTGTAEDVGPSGLKNVSLYYYHSFDNVTWSGPWYVGVDVNPWVGCSWSFTSPNATGNYRFFSRATDNSSNIEDAPVVNDTGSGYDNHAPTCLISYNRSASYFKANIRLKIYANFTEDYSGINESSIVIKISTMGNGGLENASMNRTDNTHWFSEWIIPSGSDDDGLFSIHIYANDYAGNSLAPYPTVDVSKQIDNTPPIISSVVVDNISTNSVTITWMTNEHTASCIEYGPTPSYGYWSNDSGYTLIHSWPLFGLSPITSYHYRVISYDFAANQNKSIDRSFTTLTQPSGRIPSFSVVENKSPTNPTIDGPQTGHVAVDYLYTVKSIDVDNDHLQYIINWGDATLESSGFLPNSANYSQNHRWMKAGKYLITVTVSDNHTNSSSSQIMWIDAVNIDNFGYLIDNDSDGLYNVFYSYESHLFSTIQMAHGKYLIDINGDQKWEYDYNLSSGTISSIVQQTSVSEEKPTYLYFMITGLVIIFVIVALIFISRRRHPR